MIKKYISPTGVWDIIESYDGKYFTIIKSSSKMFTTNKIIEDSYIKCGWKEDKSYIHPISVTQVNSSLYHSPYNRTLSKLPNIQTIRFIHKYKITQFYLVKGDVNEKFADIIDCDDKTLIGLTISWEMLFSEYYEEMGWKKTETSNDKICCHEMKNYVGLIETFNYCSKCDFKEYNK